MHNNIHDAMHNIHDTMHNIHDAMHNIHDAVHDAMHTIQATMFLHRWNLVRFSIPYHTTPGVVFTLHTAVTVFFLVSSLVPYHKLHT